MGKGINILVPDAFPDANAVGRATHMMAKGLAANGEPVKVISRWRSAEKGWAAPEGIPTQTHGVFDRTRRKSVPKAEWVKSAAGFALGCLGRVARGGVECTIMYGASPLFLPAAVAGRLLRRPMAFVQYDLYRPTTSDSNLKQRGSGVYAFTERFLAKSGQMVILSESPLLIDHFKAFAPEVRRFPNWPPTDAAYFAGGSAKAGRKLAAVSAETPLIIYTGAINRLEGVDLLIAAMKDVAVEHPAAVLAIAGPVTGDILPGLPPDYMKIPAELGIEKQVKFLGTVEKESVRDLLAAADCLAMPKRDHEGNQAASPIKLGEYLSSARPVVASRVCGIDQWLKDGLDVILCEAGNTKDLAGAISKTLKNREWARGVGERGRAAGVEHCDYHQWGKKFLEAWRGRAERN